MIRSTCTRALLPVVPAASGAAQERVVGDGVAASRAGAGATLTVHLPR